MGISSAVPSNAAAAHHTVAQARSWIVGKQSSGPNSYTRNQYLKMTGLHMTYGSSGCATGQYQVDDQVYSSSAIAASPAAETATETPQNVPGPCGAIADGTMRPDSWWNPASWDCGSILGSTWDKIWNGCVKGAAQGVVGTASGTLAINLLARGGKIFVGPQGYAAIAIGGCVVGLVW